MYLRGDMFLSFCFRVLSAVLCMRFRPGQTALPFGILCVYTLYIDTCPPRDGRLSHAIGRVPPGPDVIAVLMGSQVGQEGASSWILRRLAQGFLHAGQADPPPWQRFAA